MPKRLPLFLLIGFSLIGLADAFYLAESEASGTPLVCGVGGLSGCNIVAQSPYAQVFGIPLGVYGVVFYAIIFVLAAAALTLKLKRASLALFLVTAAGAVSSVVFILIQVFLIKALCIYCLLSAGVSFAAFAAAIPLVHGKPAPASLPAPAAGAGVIAP